MQKTLSCCCCPDSANAKGETLVLTGILLKTNGIVVQYVFALGVSCRGGALSPTPPMQAPWLQRALLPPPAPSQGDTMSPSQKATAPHQVALSTPPHQGVRPSTGMGLSLEQNGGLSRPIPA